MMRRLSILAFVLIAALLLLRASIGSGGLWAGAKPMLVPAVSLYLDAFNSPATAIVLCLFMVLLAAGFCYIYVGRRILPARRDVASLSSQLAAIRGRPGHAEMLDQIGQAMERHSRFTRAWHLYRATFEAGPNGVVRSRVQPSRYFNMRMLEHEGLRIGFFLDMPNDFVGLGLVFTFLGLVAGLYFASQSMMSANLDDARIGLTQLLHAATFKFLSSIAGIAISLFLSTTQRYLLGSLQAGLEDIRLRVEELLPEVAPMGIAQPFRPAVETFLVDPGALSLEPLGARS